MKLAFIPATLVLSTLLSPLAYAVNTNPNNANQSPPFQNAPQQQVSKQQYIQHKKQMMQKRAAFIAQQRAKEANNGPTFPSPEELKRMAPPKPMTEEALKQRLTLQIQRTKKVMAADKKRSAKYAEDFARYQKHQADTLAKMMAKADAQRMKVLNRMEEQQKQIIASFLKSKRISAQNNNH
ncbi:MAG: hypothetical protein ISR69_05525 [Gammaproteobacteria bacterium]|nr:hypothetical protein [Gammaproteobacteria bacterium]